jgi:hypothetical protein
MESTPVLTNPLLHLFPPLFLVATRESCRPRPGRASSDYTDRNGFHRFSTASRRLFFSPRRRAPRWPGRPDDGSRRRRPRHWDAHRHAAPPLLLRRRRGVLRVDDRHRPSVGEAEHPHGEVHDRGFLLAPRAQRVAEPAARARLAEAVQHVGRGDGAPPQQRGADEAAAGLRQHGHVHVGAAREELRAHGDHHHRVAPPRVLAAGPRGRRHCRAVAAVRRVRRHGDVRTQPARQRRVRRRQAQRLRRQDGHLQRRARAVPIIIAADAVLGREPQRGRHRRSLQVRAQVVGILGRAEGRWRAGLYRRIVAPRGGESRREEDEE